MNLTEVDVEGVWEPFVFMGVEVPDLLPPEGFFGVATRDAAAARAFSSESEERS